MNIQKYSFIVVHIKGNVKRTNVVLRVTDSRYCVSMGIFNWLIRMNADYKVYVRPICYARKLIHQFLTRNVFFVCNSILKVSHNSVKIIICCIAKANNLITVRWRPYAKITAHPLKNELKLALINEWNMCSEFYVHNLKALYRLITEHILSQCLPASILTFFFSQLRPSKLLYGRLTIPRQKLRWIAATRITLLHFLSVLFVKLFFFTAVFNP